jgi:hypothetical protein
MKITFKLYKMYKKLIKTNQIPIIINNNFILDMYTFYKEKIQKLLEDIFKSQ